MPNRRLAPLIITLATSVVAVLMPVAAHAAPPASPPAKANAVKGAKLSPRLQEVAAPGFAALPTEAQADATNAQPTGPGSLIWDGERVAVQIRLAPGRDPQTIASVAALEHIAADGTQATALVLPGALNTLAALPAVAYVTEAIEPVTHAACPTGTSVSEGVQQLKVDLARAASGADGSGVTVGIISDSYDAARAAAGDVAAGELPGSGNPCGYGTPVGATGGAAGGTDEGRAMAQIVHDLAPGAKILFADYGSTQADLADHIRALANQGATVIVDDVTYFAEPMYQDGVVAKAISDVTAAGVSYFSSAGNTNQVVAGKDVGSYRTDAFRPAACPSAIVQAYGVPGLTCHDFDPGSAVDTSWTLGVGQPISLALGWNEPQYGVATDLDLCAIDTTSNTLIGCGWDDNALSQQAFEWLSLAQSGTVAIVVVRYAGTAAPAFRIVTVDGTITSTDLPAGKGTDVVGPSAYGHNVSAATISVAAHPYSSKSVLEGYSAAGPSLTCWGPVVGSTPAARLASCQSTTVDLTATDGVRNSFFGSNVGGVWRFYGTSAAAPHAAAVAALVRQVAPCATADAVQSALTGTASPVSGVSTDHQGSGIVDAQAAVQSVQAACGPPGAHDPQGDLAASIDPTGIISFDGWAFDPDALSKPTTVMITVGGAVAAYSYADRPSPQLYPYGVPGAHGVSGQVAGPKSGSTQVCLFVLNIGLGANKTVACKQVTVPALNPVGALAASSNGEQLSINGWAFDPNDPAGTVTVMLTVNGEIKQYLYANAPRPELATYGVPGNHGFVSTLPAPGTASTEVCLWAFNLGPGASGLVECKTLSTPAYDPQADLYLSASGGTITASGYAFDLNAPLSPVTVMLTLNGSVVAYSTANQPSPQLYPYGVFGAHGYRTSFGTAVKGRNDVCVFAINIGPGKNVLASCKSVTV
ncbi:S8 family serine peptidase [Cumulibacter manganitolerans]|uniref:S8 family serine peptidase n=1 Tax=Cumulibacter manganitolerans TaxID=1884992 RepID=UPI001297B609|nr:S8 family serine peptidase [Cumulibacter manganitolerans]